jgi:hypothetical protein
VPAEEAEPVAETSEAGTVLASPPAEAPPESVEEPAVPEPRETPETPGAVSSVSKSESDTIKNLEEVS